MKTTLIQFLKSKNVLEKFKENIIKHSFEERSEKLKGEVLDLLEKDKLTMSEAFVWKETPEGEDFWIELSREWVRLSDNWTSPFNDAEARN